jgi:glutamyl-tRNA synthetase
LKTFDLTYPTSTLTTNSNRPIVGRLAPSPTGAQHLGNARTFLIAYWSIRSLGGRLILRIEDIDSPRIKPWAMDQAIEDLRWLGVEWDEGPVIQTQRRGLYQSSLEFLRERNLIYPCTCTRKDIEESGSAPHFEHELPKYPGTCSRWSLGDPTPLEGTYCWRFRTTDTPIDFVDEVQGHQSCRVRSTLGDFAVTQKSGDPSYQLAVVVDDIDMRISNVVRGDDLIISTFRQLQLLDAFESAAPSYAHVPLVRGSDGRRLAKRHGDTRLSTLRDQGVQAGDVVRWAAKTAGLIDDDFKIESARDVIEHFSWTKLNRDSIHLDSSGKGFASL